MARNYANISTAIWRPGDDFRSLSGGAQRTYFMLITQPNISAAGVLPLTIGRWARNAADTTASTLRTDLGDLEKARYVVVDDDTEELLIRSFVKWDGGHGNPKRRPVIRDAAREIASPTIRRALGEEFARLGLPPEWLPDTQADSLSGSLAEPMGDGDSGGLPEAQGREIAETDKSASSQVNSLSDSHADGISPSERVVVTKATYIEPQPSTHNPQPLMPENRADAQHAAEPTETQRSKTITDAYRAAQPMCRWPAINGVVLTAIRAGKYGDDEIRAAMLRLAAEGRTVSVETLRIEIEGHAASRAASNGNGYRGPYRNRTDPSAYHQEQL